MLREAFLGEICMVAFHFVPQGWMFCDGRLLNVKQYESLYNF
jgi:microcystin-dependent protein